MSMKYYDSMRNTVTMCLRAAVIGVQIAACLSRIDVYELRRWFTATDSQVWRHCYINETKYAFSQLNSQYVAHVGSNSKKSRVHSAHCLISLRYVLFAEASSSGASSNCVIRSLRMG